MESAVNVGGYIHTARIRASEVALGISRRMPVGYSAFERDDGVEER